jgi:hypothetical protein
MSVGFIRVVESSTNTWADNTNGIWNKIAIESYFSDLKDAYTGKEGRKRK